MPKYPLAEYSTSGFITYKFQVASYEFRVAVLRNYIYELRVPFYELQRNFWVATLFCEVEIKSRVEICFSKNFNLRVASCFLRVESLRW